MIVCEVTLPGGHKVKYRVHTGDPEVAKRRAQEWADRIASRMDARGLMYVSGSIGGISRGGS